MENSNAASNLSNNPSAIYEEKRFKELKSNGGTVEEIYQFYPLTDFLRSKAFLKALFFVTSNKEYFSPKRCYYWTAWTVGSIAMCIYAGEDLLNKFFDLNFWLQIPIGLFVGLVILGFFVIATEVANLIFWPKQTVGALSIKNYSRGFSYFRKNEEQNGNDLTVIYYCLHPIDYESNYQNFRKEDFVSPIYSIFKFLLYAAGAGCIVLLAIGLLGWVSTIPTNTILLVIIIFILLYKKKN